MLDTCTGTFVISKACLWLPELRRFGARENNSACFQDEAPLLVEGYGKQISSADSDMTGSDEAAEASKVVVIEVAAFPSKRGFDCWNVAPGLAPVQSFSAHIMHCQ